MNHKDFLTLTGAGMGMLTLPACSSKKAKLSYPKNPFSRPLSFPKEINANKFEL
jgi:hypothetical protein